ncbi:MAG: PhzF family phenazine biosynthesis isomerase [Candidatus Heimdallarchaeota archaeon]|nr:PhzF family phenazine biosynthesis isomerase [Candidatus Heimdallarchaeota archaeon]
MAFQRKKLTKQVGIKQIDVFTEEPFQGNPLLIVLYAENLSDQEKGIIVKELNAQKGAFIFDADDGKSDFKLRVFTPEGEIDSDSHSTIGGTFIMLRKKQLKLQDSVANIITIQTREGICPLLVEMENGEIQRVLTMRTMETEPQFRMVDYDIQNVSEVFRLPSKSIRSDIIMRSVKIDEWAMMIPLKDPKLLEELVIDEPSLIKMAKENLVESICLFAIDEKENGENKVVTRIFQEIENDAGEKRIIEDEITGKSNTNIAVFLFEQKLWRQEGSKMLIKFVQKTGENREGEIVVEMDIINEEIKEIRLGGVGIPIVDGKMIITRY